MTYFSSRWTGALLLALPFFAQAQSVGVNNSAPDPSAVLDVTGTNKGMLVPRVASTAAIASPAAGLLVYQTGTPAGFYYNAGNSTNASWQQLATTAGAAANALSNNGQSVTLGGSLGAPTTILQAGNSFSLTGGNVGVGTAAPSATLETSGDFRVSNGTTAAALGTGTNGNVALGGTLTQATTIATAGNSLAITGTDNVGIGTSGALSSPLQVGGAVALPYVTTGTTAGTFTLTEAHHTVRRFDACTNISIPQPSTCPGRIYTIISSNGSSSNVGLGVQNGGFVYDDVDNAFITFLGPNARLTI